MENQLAHSERLASIGRFASGVAHEIGNPVTGIACLAQNLEAEISDPKINSEIQEKTDKLKDQLFLVTNNKQYDALMNEIDHLKEEKSSFETDILNFLEEKESLKDSVTSIESTLGCLCQWPRVFLPIHAYLNSGC